MCCQSVNNLKVDKREGEKSAKEGGEKEKKQTACATWVKPTPLFPGVQSPCCLWQPCRHTLQRVRGNDPDGDGDRFKARSQYGAAGFWSQSYIWNFIGIITSSNTLAFYSTSNKHGLNVFVCTTTLAFSSSYWLLAIQNVEMLYKKFKIRRTLHFSS